MLSFVGEIIFREEHLCTIKLVFGKIIDFLAKSYTSEANVKSTMLCLSQIIVAD